MKRLRSRLVVWLLVVFPTIAVSALLAQDPPIDPIDPFLASQSTSFLLTNVRIVDGTGAAAREGLSLAIEDGMIAAMGSATAIEAPSGAERIDLTGHTILPGLIMMHEHLGYAIGTNPDPSVDQVGQPHPNSIPKLLLAAGVTTARTAGSDTPQIDLNLKQRIDRGAAVGPTLFTGPFLNGPERAYLGDFVVRTADEAREVVRFWVRRGATMIKVYENIAPEALEGAVEEAHRLGAHVAGHLGPGTSCTRAAQLGIDTIEHGFAECGADIPPGWLADPTAADPGAPEVTAVIDALVENGVVIVATPIQWPPSEEELSMLNAVQRARYEALRAAPPPFLELFLDPPPEIQAFAGAISRAFVAAGGTMLIGADANNGGRIPGYANHTAMILLADTFAPLEVIRMATSDPAGFLRIADRTGRVAPGLEADLLIVRGAPDRDMADVRNVAYVFKDGRLFDPQKLRDSAKGMVGSH
jgi:enamidase